MLNESSLDDLKILMRLSDKIVRYKINIGLSYSFIVFGSFYTVALILALSINVPDYKLRIITIFMGLIIAGIISTIIVRKLIKYALRMIPTVELDKKRKILRIVCFTVPFILVYSILDILQISNYLFNSTIWYLALGFALVAEHVLVYSKYSRKGIFISKPFLESGLSIILSYPIIYVLLEANILIQELASLSMVGFMMLIYTITSLRTLFISEKIFEE